MFCGMCGAQIPDGCDFCPRCGSDLRIPGGNGDAGNAGPAAGSGAAYKGSSGGRESHTAGRAEPARAKKSRGKIVLILAVVLILALLAGGAAVYMTSPAREVQELIGNSSSSSEDGEDVLSEIISTLENDAADTEDSEEDVTIQEDVTVQDQEEDITVLEEASSETVEKPAEESQTNAVEIANVASRNTVGGGEVWYRINYYTESGETERGYMNTEGTVLSEEPMGLYENNTLYDEDGNEIYSAGSSDDRWYIICAEEFGTYLALEVQSGLESVNTYIGLIDETGKWQDGSPVEVDSSVSFTGEGFILGEGMLAALSNDRNQNDLYIFNTETGENFIVSNVRTADRDFWSFYNGIFIYETGHKVSGKIFSVDKDGNKNYLAEYQNLLHTGKNGFLTNEGGLSFYANNGELIWTFDDYELSDDYTPVLYEDVTFVFFEGADGNTYIGCLSQTDGSLLYTPLKINYSYNYYCGHLLLTKLGKKNYSFVDMLTGDVISELEYTELGTAVEYCEDGIFILNEMDDDELGYTVYDAEGNEIQAVLQQ